MVLISVSPSPLMVLVLELRNWSQDDSGSDSIFSINNSKFGSTMGPNRNQPVYILQIDELYSHVYPRTYFRIDSTLWDWCVIFHIYSLWPVPFLLRTRQSNHVKRIFSHYLVFFKYSWMHSFLILGFLIYGSSISTFYFCCTQFSFHICCSMVVQRFCYLVHGLDFNFGKLYSDNIVDNQLL